MATISMHQLDGEAALARLPPMLPAEHGEGNREQISTLFGQAIEAAPTFGFWALYQTFFMDQLFQPVTNHRSRNASFVYESIKPIGTEERPLHDQKYRHVADHL